MAAAAAALVLLGGAGSAFGSAFAGQNGRIFFAHNAGSSTVIDSINPNGSGLLQVTHPGGGLIDGAPRVSPDGQRVVFTRGNSSSSDIWIANADGSNPQQLTAMAQNTFAFEPSFSADGAQVVYGVSTGSAATTGIWEMTAAGQGQHLLLSGSVSQPSFSADGTRLAFMNATVAGDQLDVGAGDGSGAVALFTANGTLDSVGWSPGCGALVGSDSSGVDVVSASGGGGTVIADTQSTVYFNPAFSPDGTELVLSSGARSGVTGEGLFIAATDGSGIVPIPNTGGPGVHDTAPDWAIAAGSATTGCRGGGGGGGGKAPTSTAVSCNYTFATFSETCTATVGGGPTPPTGQVTFSSASGGVFPFGASCTLTAPTSNSASCQVQYDPPGQSLGTITTLQITASYAGDSTHNPSSGQTSPTTAAIISGLQGDITQACNALPGTFNPQTVILNGITVIITVPVPGTINITVAENGGGSTLPIAADPGAHVTAGGGGATLPNCTVTFDGSGGILPIAADPSAIPAATAIAGVHKPRCTTRKRHGHKHRVCTPATITLAQLHHRFTTHGGKIVLHVKLNRTGRRLLKKLLAADRAYIKKHHHRRGAPTLKLRVTITFAPA